MADRTSLFARLWSSWNGLFARLPEWVFVAECREAGPETWKAIHDETSKTIRRVFHILVATCLFCAITLGGTPDRQIVVPTATVTLPILNYPLGFPTFLVIGPLVLIALTVYLHVFVVHQRRHPLEVDLRTPMLPNMGSVSARVITWLLFYWLTPVTLAFFTWEAWPRPIEGTLLFWTTIGTTVALTWIQVRRCPARWRGWAVPGLLLVLLCFCLALHKLTEDRVLNLFAENLSGEDLRPMKALDGAVLEEANLREAELSGVSFANAQLDRADLRKAKAKRAKFTDARLPGAHLDGADLEGANLSSGYLIGAELNDTNLEAVQADGANLLSAKLVRATLVDAILDRAKFSHADLSHAKLLRVQLQEANMEAADLTDADLTNANFNRAALPRATLKNAVLTGAILADVDFRNATFDGANLDGAKLDGARLQGADLSSAQGLAQRQLDQACGDESTRIPAGLSIAPCPAEPNK